MATPSNQGRLTPADAVESYLRAWRDGDADAQWDLSMKVGPEGAFVEHHVTNAIVERWSRDEFGSRFPALKAKYYDRYVLRRLRVHRSSSDRARVHYAARRKDSLLEPHLPFLLSQSRFFVELCRTVFRLYPWYDALSYFDVVRTNGSWLLADWQYYKY